jgi:hypothetical protein
MVAGIAINILTAKDCTNRGYLSAVYAIVNMLYLYLAEDYVNWLIRESGGTVTLQDLAHFSNNNNRPGIM